MRHDEGRRRDAVRRRTKVAEGRVEVTNPFGYSVDETCDVGRDRASPVSADYPARDNRFTGTVNWVELDAEEARLDVARQ